MKDYFGNEIHMGDTILFSGRKSRNHPVSFDESVVTEFKGNTKVLVGGYYLNDYRFGYDVINLTALGIRPRKEVKSNE